MMRLTEDEKKFMNYLLSRGGSAFLSEVRKTLGLPHTSAWRMARRLQCIGLVRAVKVRVGDREFLKISLKKGVRS